MWAPELVGESEEESDEDEDNSLAVVKRKSSLILHAELLSFEAHFANNELPNSCFRLCNSFMQWDVNPVLDTHECIVGTMVSTTFIYICTEYVKIMEKQTLIRENIV